MATWVPRPRGAKFFVVVALLVVAATASTTARRYNPPGVASPPEVFAEYRFPANGNTVSLENGHGGGDSLAFTDGSNYYTSGSGSVLNYGTVSYAVVSGGSARGFELPASSTATPIWDFTLEIVAKLSQVSGDGARVADGRFELCRNLAVVNGVLSYGVKHGRRGNWEVKASGGQVTPDNWFQVVMARTKGGSVKVWLDGAEVFTYTDNDSDLDDVGLREDKDDKVYFMFREHADENSAQEGRYSVALVKLWNGALNTPGAATLAPQTPACTLDCGANHDPKRGSLDSDRCACTCLGSWVGTDCDNCNIACGGGQLKNSDDCTCYTPSPVATQRTEPPRPAWDWTGHATAGHVAAAATTEVPDYGWLPAPGDSGRGYTLSAKVHVIDFAGQQDMLVQGGCGGFAFVLKDMKMALKKQCKDNSGQEHLIVGPLVSAGAKYLSVSYDGSIVRFYVNGANVHEVDQSLPAMVNPGGTKMYIGGFPDLGDDSESFKGTIAGAAVWKGVLEDSFLLSRLEAHAELTKNDAVGCIPALTACAPLPEAPITGGESLVEEFLFDKTYTSNSPPHHTISQIGSAGGYDFTVGTIYPAIPSTTLTKPSLNFNAGHGLELAGTGAPGHYWTVEIIAKLHDVKDYTRILDWSSGQSDNGLYAFEGQLKLYPGIAGGELVANEWFHLVMSRNGAGTVTAVLSKPAASTTGHDPYTAFQYDDSVSKIAVSPSGTWRFFKDDSDQDASGSVALIRLFNGVMSYDNMVRLATSPYTYPLPDTSSAIFELTTPVPPNECATVRDQHIPANMNGQFTILAHVVVSDVPNGKQMVFTRMGCGAPMFYLDNMQWKLSRSCEDDSKTIATGVTATAGSHAVALTYDGLKAQIFTDTVAGAATTMAMTFDNLEPVLVGCADNSGVTEVMQWKGKVCNLDLFDTVLTPGQIQERSNRHECTTDMMMAMAELGEVQSPVVVTRDQPKPKFRGAAATAVTAAPHAAPVSAGASKPAVAAGVKHQ